MPTWRRTLTAAGIALAGCGDSIKAVGPGDGAVQHDSGSLGGAIPTPPALGPQIDRAGRPAITTALIGTFSASSARAAVADAYNHADTPATWIATALPAGGTVRDELASNLAVFDALDIGMSVNLPGYVAGCGNALRYLGPVGPSSYGEAAKLFADDQIYVDTSYSTCSMYLALELEYATGTTNTILHSSCGGRAPKYDVVDVTYSVLAAGSYGLDPARSYAPRLGDGVTPHTDVTETFPFLGPPHPRP